MMNKKIIAMLSVVLVVGVFWIVFARGNQPNDQEQLGKFLFFDTNLSDSSWPVLCGLPWTGCGLDGT